MRTYSSHLSWEDAKDRESSYVAMGSIYTYMGNVLFIILNASHSKGGHNICQRAVIRSWLVLVYIGEITTSISQLYSSSVHHIVF